MLKPTSGGVCLAATMRCTNLCHAKNDRAGVRCAPACGRVGVALRSSVGGRSAPRESKSAHTRQPAEPAFAENFRRSLGGTAWCSAIHRATALSFAGSSMPNHQPPVSRSELMNDCGVAGTRKGTGVPVNQQLFVATQPASELKAALCERLMQIVGWRWAAHVLLLVVVVLIRRVAFSDADACGKHAATITTPPHHQHHHPHTMTKAIDQGN